MVSITEYLPGIPHSYWIDFVQSIEPTHPKIIKAGQSDVQLLSGTITNRRGLILETLLNSSSPDMLFTIQSDDRKISGTIQNLYDGGYTSYIPNVPFLSQYDSTTDDYVLNLITTLPFNHDVYLYVSNPTTTDMVISGMIFHAVIFNKGFYTQLAKLISGIEN